jgi:hypothetical protein
MLPRIFTVLFLLNAGLFYWGYQREQSLEAPPTPMPEGRYELRLLGEPRESWRKEGGNAGDAALEGSSPDEMAAEGAAAQAE